MCVCVYSHVNVHFCFNLLTTTVISTVVTSILLFFFGVAVARITNFPLPFLPQFAPLFLTSPVKLDVANV